METNTKENIMNGYKSTNFCREIESLKNRLEISYIDSVLHFCLSNEVEIEDVTKLINKQLKEKLEVEARDLNFLPKIPTLEEVI